MDLYIGLCPYVDGSRRIEITMAMFGYYVNTLKNHTLSDVVPKVIIDMA